MIVTYHTGPSFDQIPKHMYSATSPSKISFVVEQPAPGVADDSESCMVFGEKRRAFLDPGLGKVQALKISTEKLYPLTH